MLRVGLLRTMGESPYPENVLTGSRNNATFNNAGVEILLTKKVIATNHEAKEFLESDYNVND